MYLLIFTLIFFTIFQFIINRKISNLGFLFNLWWLIIITSFNIFKDSMYPIGSNVYIYFFLGTIIFNIFYFLFFTTKSKFLNYLSIELSTENENFYNKYIVIIQFIMLLFLIPFVLKNLPSALAGGLLEVRANYLGHTSTLVFNNTFQRILYIHLGIFPCISACIMLHAILWSQGKIKIKSLIIDFINLLCLLIITGARTYIYYSAIYFIGAFVINYNKMKKKSRRQSSRLKRNIILLTAILIISGLIITSQRTFYAHSSSAENLRDTFIIYFCGGIKVFDIALVSPNIFGFSNHTYGLSIFSGIISIFVLLLNSIPYIGGFTTQLPTNLVQQYLENNINIGPHLSMNAFATMYYYFYRDMGTLGIIFGNLILAYVSAKFSKRILKSNNYLNQIVYLQTLLLIVFSVCWWEPSRMEFYAVLFYAVFIIKFIEKMELKKGKK